MGNCCSCCCCKTKQQYLVHERVERKQEVPRPVPTMKIPEKVEEPIKKDREYLPPFANQNEDFLTSHLKYELSLTKLTDMRKIRRRQIFEHLKLQIYWIDYAKLKGLEIKDASNADSLNSAWIQRSFLDIWNKAHDDIFVKEEDVKLVRRKVAEQFMFELYEMKEYIDSGLSSYTFMSPRRRAYFTESFSDEALYYLFRTLKTRYPQTAIKGSIQVPEIKNTKTDVNLFDHFPAKCFSDPSNINCQIIYDDVLFMLNKAIEEQESFKNDMKDLIGEDVLTGLKVDQVTKYGETYFNACAIMRMFLKWAENLLENCSDLKKTEIFQKFKWEITNRFFFKDDSIPGISEIVVDELSKLIELAKYDLRTGNRRQEFTFNIYDLLRCKVKRKTAQEVVAIFKKLEKTSQTKSGKRFQVIRTKNRFQTNNMDILVNFRYGDVLVAEAQIGVDAFEEVLSNKKAKLNNAVHQYIEKLERSIFGPTFELMMQYEENERPDLTLSLQAKGQIQKRKNQLIDTARITNRKCFNGHSMVSMEGNHWYKDENQNLLIKAQYLQIDCAFCNATYRLSTEFDFCYQCESFYCKDCAKDYQKIDLRNTLATIEKEDELKEINSYRQLSDICSKKKSFIVLFWLQGSSASIMFKDTIVLNQNKLRFQLNQFIPNVGHVKYSNKPEIQNIINKLRIKEYPTLILFDQNAIPFKTVLGFSWFQAPVLFALQKHILSNKKYEQLIEYCTLCQKQQKNSRMFADEKRQVCFCTGCFNTATEQYLPKQVVGYGSYCSEGHYRCMNCSYAILKIPSVYKDFLGNSYLSTTFVNPNLKQCPNGHQTQLFKGNPTKSWEYTCWNCQKKYFYDNQHGVGVCTKGQSALCPRCMGAEIPTFRELSHIQNFAKHFSESTQQSTVCYCGKKMKKVYENRSLHPSQRNKIEMKNWKCSMCQREKNGKELHLACFSCTFLSQNTERTSFNLCMKCATISRIIAQQKKRQQRKDELKCPTDSSPLTYRSMIKQETNFTCKNCKKLYYDSTASYNCPTCKQNYCEDCKKGLQYLHPTICKQTCEQGHSLRKRMINVEKMDIDQCMLDLNLKKGPRLCSRCLDPVGFSDYNCEQDQFQLCQTCVRSSSAGIVENIVQKALRLGREIEDFSYVVDLAEVHDNYAKEKSKVQIQSYDDSDEYKKNDR